MKFSVDSAIIRIGAIFLSIFAILANLPIVFVSTMILGNFGWTTGGHIILFVASWISLILTAITALICQIRPSERTYIFVASSFGFTLATWGLWFTPLTKNIIH